MLDNQRGWWAAGPDREVNLWGQGAAADMSPESLITRLCLSWHFDNEQSTLSTDLASDKSGRATAKQWGIDPNAVWCKVSHMGEAWLLRLRWEVTGSRISLWVSAPALISGCWRIFGISWPWSWHCGSVEFEATFKDPFQAHPQVKKSKQKWAKYFATIIMVFKMVFPHKCWKKRCLRRS